MNEQEITKKMQCEGELVHYIEDPWRGGTTEQIIGCRREATHFPYDSFLKREVSFCGQCWKKVKDQFNSIIIGVSR